LFHNHKVQSLDERVRSVLESPLAAATFRYARVNGVTVEDMADPSIAVAVTSRASRDLAPWTGRASDARAKALSGVALLEPFITAVLADPRNAWWSSDLSRARQLWVSEPDVDFDPAQFSLTPNETADQWETYAQRPGRGGWMFSSTRLEVPVDDEIRSGLHNELAHEVDTDWFPEYPLRQAAIEVAAAARIYEIHRPKDWHELTLRYADLDRYRGADQNLLKSAGIDHGPAPDWGRLARDWDGIHLSFFGLLTTLYTPVTIAGVTTTVWSWPSERTLWLRSAFDRVTSLPPLTEQPRPADHARRN
jgi:hypothetical protein